jgi:hypothetical protein
MEKQKKLANVSSILSNKQKSQRYSIWEIEPVKTILETKPIIKGKSLRSRKRLTEGQRNVSLSTSAQESSFLVLKIDEKISSYMNTYHLNSH